MNHPFRAELRPEIIKSDLIQQYEKIIEQEGKLSVRLPETVFVGLKIFDPKDSLSSELDPKNLMLYSEDLGVLKPLVSDKNTATWLNSDTGTRITAKKGIITKITIGSIFRAPR